VLTAGQTFILGYTNEEDGIYNASKEKPVVIFDDFTGAYRWIDFKFKVKSSVLKMLTTKTDTVLLRYVFYAMGYLGFTSNENKRLWISTYSKFKIPVPPLEVQEKIVETLDKFDAYCTDLTQGLPAEIELRQKQYEYYRDKLLTFNN
jgi:type I restriction enzyme S subunit